MAKRFASLPRTPLGGLLFDDDYIRMVLINKAIEKTTNKSGFTLQLKSYCGNLNEGIPSLAKINWRPSFYIDLPECPTKIDFGSKKHNHNVKWGVSRARSLGLYTREAQTIEDLENWYNLYLKTMRWHFVPARPFRFFKFLWDKFKPLGYMSLLLSESVEGDKTILQAGSIFLKYNGKVFYSFNGRTADALASHANDLIQWEIIFKSCSEGYTSYDMGEVSEGNCGLVQFKSKWGCSPHFVYHYYFPSPDSNENADLDITKNNEKFKQIWRKLPLGVTRELGSLINRFL